MSKLRIAEGLSLPIDAVTETFAVLAKRGAGKTYAANVLAEEMLSAGAQVVVLDPLDAWWGLRSSADGKGAGLPIYVFGGEHGDLPLEATAGELIADVVVDHGASVICSLRHLAKGKQRQFVTAFAERLYHRKGEPEHRSPLHVFIDEADAFVPQRVLGESARMVGAVDDIVRRGRNAGLGVTLISQRAAVVNKDVLTQAEVLVALRTISPQDRKALEAWIEAHDAHDQRHEFMASLASLDIGEAWIWSPGWLDLFSRVGFGDRIANIGVGIVDAIKRVQSDPAGGRVTQAPRGVPARPAGDRAQTAVATPAPAARPQPAPIQADIALGRGERAVLIAVAQYPGGAARDQLSVLTGYKRSSRNTYLQRLAAAGYIEAAGGDVVRATDAGVAALGSDYEPLPQGQALQDYWRARLPEGERRVFDVLVAAYPDAVLREQIDEQTGYRRSSRNTYLQRLRSRRLVETVGPDEVRASEDLF